ncbi:hypothetical protein SAMN02910369_00784 [Lachnospiraceae bacterium NE2001]|nr:hypothetical protein SAMN02910369_00784 [Lachnospiraceae bacterium NE2001]
MFKKHKKIVGLALALMLMTSGCGSTPTEVTDYGQTSESLTSEGEDGSAVEESAGKGITDMLGGTELEASKSFQIAGKNATVNVIYNAKNLQNLSVYKVDSISESNLDEDAIVKTLLGDTAERITASDDKKYLKYDDGDSSYVINTSLWILYHNGVKTNYFTDSVPLDTDDPSVFLHFYEGERNGIQYQLMVSYSKNYNELIISCYPKKVGEVVGDDSIDWAYYTCPDGNFYYYLQKLESYKIDEIMSDRPNACTLSNDEVTASAQQLLKDLSLDIPEAAIDPYINMHDVIMSEGQEPKRLEVIFFNDAALETVNLDGAVRNGYMVGVMDSLNGLKIMQDTEKIDSDADQLSTGVMYINDDGVMGLDVTTKYLFQETVTDNATLLSFDEAMESFAKVAAENLTSEDIKRENGKIEFDKIDLVYFPIPTENSNEYMLTPAWSLEAQNSNYQTIARVLISATDGSYITTLHED